MIAAASVRRLAGAPASRAATRAAAASEAAALARLDDARVARSSARRRPAQACRTHSSASIATAIVTPAASPGANAPRTMKNT